MKLFALAKELQKKLADSEDDAPDTIRTPDTIPTPNLSLYQDDEEWVPESLPRTERDPEVSPESDEDDWSASPTTVREHPREYVLTSDQVQLIISSLMSYGESLEEGELSDEVVDQIADIMEKLESEPKSVEELEE